MDLSELIGEDERIIEVSSFEYNKLYCIIKSPLTNLNIPFKIHNIHVTHDLDTNNSSIYFNFSEKDEIFHYLSSLQRAYFNKKDYNFKLTIKQKNESIEFFNCFLETLVVDLNEIASAHIIATHFLDTRTTNRINNLIENLNDPLEDLI